MPWRSFGKCTFFSLQGYKSLVDYTLVSDSFFSNISSLIVESLTYLSDHCKVTTNIKNTVLTRVPLVIQIINGNIYLSPLSAWKNTSSAKDFRNALNTPHIKAKIDYFMSNRFPETKEGIENANRLLTNILCKAAKLSLPTSRVRRFKTHKPKKWFSKSCSRARVLFKQANKYPSKT